MVSALRPWGTCVQSTGWPRPRLLSKVCNGCRALTNCAKTLCRDHLVMKPWRGPARRQPEIWRPVVSLIVVSTCQASVIVDAAVTFFYDGTEVSRSPAHICCLQCFSFSSNVRPFGCSAFCFAWLLQLSIIYALEYTTSPSFSIVLEQYEVTFLYSFGVVKLAGAGWRWPAAARAGALSHLQVTRCDLVKKGGDKHARVSM